MKGLVWDPVDAIFVEMKLNKRVKALKGTLGYFCDLIIREGQILERRQSFKGVVWNVGELKAMQNPAL